MMNMTIKVKLFLLIGFMAAIMGFLGYYSNVNMRYLDDQDTRLYEKMTVPLGQLGVISNSMGNINDIAWRIAFTGNKTEDVEKMVNDVKEHITILEKNCDAYKETLLDADDEKNYKLMLELKKIYLAEFGKITTLANAGKIQEITDIIKGSYGKAADAFSQNINKIIDFNIKAAKKQSDENTATCLSVLSALNWTIAVSIFVSLLIGYFIAKSIGDILGFVIAECNMLTQAAAEGKLDIRGNAERTNFEFRPIVQGINRTLDAVIGPLNVAGEYIDRISKSDIPPKITDNYKGDFNEIKNNMNCLIDILNNFSKSMTKMADDHKAGDIESFIDEKQFAGPYRKMAEGVNSMVKFHVDSILLFFKVTSSYSEGDFNATLPKFPGKAAIANQIMDSVRDNLRGVVNETVGLVNSAVEGKLSARGNASGFKGGFREIIEGMNRTLDAIVAPLDKTADCLKEMANGNLDISMDGEYKGDYAILKNSVNATLASMNDILGHVSAAVDQVNSGANQVSDASQSLSQAATEQASSLEEIGASLNEINAQTKQNADNAVQANLLAGGTRTVAEGGNEKMRLMVAAMNEINESASNISKIIKAIDEIAFQTNLLALNAAVEAARAGKHGKGFTVVAEEVRNLAQRSAKAAKETAEMIESSIKKTEAGSKIAGDTSKSLEEIVSSVTKVTDLIGEIAAASKEQSLGISQVNQGVGQIDRATQQNTATAEQAAAASEELSAQAVELRGMLAKFRLNNSGSRQLSLEKVVNAYSRNDSKKNAARITKLEIETVKGRPQVKDSNTVVVETGAKSTRTANPRDVINLDDSEFGKF